MKQLLDMYSMPNKKLIIIWVLLILVGLAQSIGIEIINAQIIGLSTLLIILIYTYAFYSEFDELKKCMNSKVKVGIKTEEGVVKPKYVHEGDSGMDVRAFLKNSISIHPKETKLIPTGIYLDIPEGLEIQVRSRSGQSLKKGLVVSNSPGTVDSSYKNKPLGIILYNNSDTPRIITNGDRIAQIVLAKVETIEWKELDESEIDSDRTGGFGSTGTT